VIAEQGADSERAYVIEAKLKGGKQYEKPICLSTLEDFVRELPLDERKKAYNLPDAKTSKVSKDKRIELVQEFLSDMQIKSAKEKCSEVTIAATIMLLAEGVGQVDKISVKQKAKLRKAQDALAKHVEASHHQILKYFDLCKKNEDNREMPYDREEIPKESGNVYMNKEPTISLKTVRKKVKSLNTQIQKELGVVNRESHAAKTATAGGASAAADNLNDQKCLICSGLFRNGTTIRIFPCGHFYHDEKCAQPWLKTGANICPACQCELIVTDKEAPDDQCASVDIAKKWGWKETGS
jgi:hypothetical protein